MYFGQVTRRDVKISKAKAPDRKREKQWECGGEEEEEGAKRNEWVGEKWQTVWAMRHYGVAVSSPELAKGRRRGKNRAYLMGE